MLALAHLFNFLPEWDAELHRIAQKLYSSGGSHAYEQFKDIQDHYRMMASI